MVEEASVTTEETKSAEVVEPKYDLHIEVPGEMRQVLRTSAELAYKMGDIEKPDLVNLMNLFIGWGLRIQKKKWADKMGYKIDG